MVLNSGSTSLKAIIQGIPALIEAFTSTVPKPGVAIVLFLLFLWPVINGKLGPLLEAFERRKRRKLELINEYVSSENMASEDTLAVLKDLRDAHYFMIATGIREERHGREALTRAHDAMSHAVTWTHLRRAREFIEISEDQSISVKEPTTFQRFTYWYNVFIGAIFMFCGVGLLVWTWMCISIWHTEKPIAILYALAVCCFLVLIAMYAFSQNWPFQARSLVAKELAKLNGTSTKVPAKETRDLQHQAS